MPKSGSLTEFFADPRREAVEKRADTANIPLGAVIPESIFRECGYSDDEIRALFPETQGWVKHDGGECPLSSETEVEVKFRSLTRDTETGPASSFGWYWSLSGYDILEYRVSERS